MDRWYSIDPPELRNRARFTRAFSLDFARVHSGTHVATSPRMVARSSLRLFGITGGALLLGALAACAAPDLDDGSEGTSAAVTAKPFDKNNIIDDKSMRDATTLTSADVQKLLEKTPWGTASALATYTEGGKSAAEIMTAAAVAHKLNPLELVVRTQMEQGLISKTTAPAATIAKAFGCGCPDGSSCSDKYQGFAAQAECAAGTMDRAISAAQTSAGTVSGWARSKAKASQDAVTVTPANASTAALYTYTPWVGEAGGGKAGVGGVSLHYQVWDRFAQWTSYGAYANTVLETDTDAGTTTTTDDPDASEPTEPTTPDAGTPPDEGKDSGVTAAPTQDDAGTKSGPPSDGSDDGTILGDGSAPPASNAPPPSSTKSIPTKPSELETASDDDLTSKKKTSAGCSTSGTNHAGSGLLIGGAVAISAMIARRRRQP